MLAVVRSIRPGFAGTPGALGQHGWCTASSATFGSEWAVAQAAETGKAGEPTAWLVSPHRHKSCSAAGRVKGSSKPTRGAGGGAVDHPSLWQLLLQLTHPQPNLQRGGQARAASSGGPAELQTRLGAQQSRRRRGRLPSPAAREHSQVWVLEKQVLLR